jgi:hypothetical protein
MSSPEAFNAWLNRHLEFQRTAKGNKTNRLTSDSELQLRRLLGQSIVGPALRYRKGEDVAYLVKKAIAEIVELEEPELILELRERQKEDWK